MPKRGIDKEAKELLIKIITKLKTSEMVTDFLNDIFSSAEVKDFSRRLLAAKLLFEGKTYEDINSMMGMSAGTINKVHFKTKGSNTLPKLLSDDC